MSTEPGPPPPAYVTLMADLEVETTRGLVEVTYPLLVVERSGVDAADEVVRARATSPGWAVAEPPLLTVPPGRSPQDVEVCGGPRTGLRFGTSALPVLDDPGFAHLPWLRAAEAVGGVIVYVVAGVDLQANGLFDRLEYAAAGRKVFAAEVAWRGAY